MSLEESLVSDVPKWSRTGSEEGGMTSVSKKTGLMCSTCNDPHMVAEIVENWGVLVEESKESSGCGCLKWGTPEGDSVDGESETG